MACKNRELKTHRKCVPLFSAHLCLFTAMLSIFQNISINSYLLQNLIMPVFYSLHNIWQFQKAYKY